VLFVLAMLAPLASLVISSLADSYSAQGALPAAYSLRWYQRFASNPHALGSLFTSLALATVATTLALAVGLPASWALARGRRRFAGPIEGVLLLRAAAPVIVVALGSAIIAYRLRLADTWPGLILAHAAGALPFVVWTARPALAGLDPDGDAAARDLGAGPARRLGLALGAVLPALAAGALLAWLFSLDEFAVTFLISGQRIVTLPVLLYGALEEGSAQAAAAVAVVMMAPAIVIAGAAAWVMGGWERALGGLGLVR
jgi:putative spermidine/putrescine transport system permease protein